jgi:hypothetical protein
MGIQRARRQTVAANPDLDLIGPPARATKLQPICAALNCREFLQPGALRRCEGLCNNVTAI